MCAVEGGGQLPLIPGLPIRRVCMFAKLKLRALGLCISL
jgi:hypothetical protein